MVASTSNLILGEGSTWRNRHLDGKLLDVRLWNVVRSEEEIQSSMYSFLNGNETGLVANWKTDEGSGTTLGDATGNFPGSIQDGVNWFSLSGTGIPGTSLEVQNADIFPNPAAEYVTVKNLKNVVTSLEIIDITGKRTYSGMLDPMETIHMDVSGFKSGIYLARFSNSSGTQIKKLIVQ
jgi:hypothetical protein